MTSDCQLVRSTRCAHCHVKWPVTRSCRYARLVLIILLYYTVVAAWWLSLVLYCSIAVVSSSQGPNPLFLKKQGLRTKSSTRCEYEGFVFSSYSWSPACVMMSHLPFSSCHVAKVMCAFREEKPLTPQHVFSLYISLICTSVKCCRFWAPKGAPATRVVIRSVG
jgi:hypothetical protein